MEAAFKFIFLLCIVFCADCQHKPIDPLPVDFCPPEAMMAPCKCTGYANVECEPSLTTGDLTRIFKLHWGWPEAYRVVAVKNSAVTSLQGNIFGSVRFEYFYFVNNKDLQTIEKHAFRGSELNAEIVVMSNNSLRDTSVYEAIRELENLRLVDLRGNQLERIPDHAFGHLAKLDKLYLENNKIKHIGAYAFDHLNSLTYLGLSNNHINKLEDNSFAFRPGSSELIIQLSGNHLEQVTENAFRAIDRSVNLFLSQNDISVLSRDSFEPLVYGRSHEVSVAGNPIKCDCTLKWIAERPQYHHLLADAICTNGKDPASVYSDLIMYCYEEFSLETLAYKKK